MLKRGDDLLMTGELVGCWFH